MARIYVLHENKLWLPPLATALDRLGLPWTEWFLDGGVFDLSVPPPEGVFYNRMSASSHTRDHRYSAELTASVLAWLTRYGRNVVNGSGALDLEISKIRQYSKLQREGVETPRTVLVAGRDRIITAYKQYFSGQPVILKPNRGGKGLGVKLFRTIESLTQYVNSDEYEQPVDGLQLLQEYILAPRPVITRAEFIGQQFLYAVEVDTSDGFELCPADACRTGENCPTTNGAITNGTITNGTLNKFTIVEDIPSQLRERLERFLSSSGIDIAGIEFITETSGRTLVYDVNTNTNYNPEAEEMAGCAGTGHSGPGAIASYLGSEFLKLNTNN